MRENSFDLALLRREIKPFRLHWFSRLRSTNDHAAALRRRGKLFAPAVVLTGHQLAGRGRGSNTWWSGSGSLTVTFVLPVDEHLAGHHVPLIAGLAVRNAISAMTNTDEIQLKWPNDILFEHRKLAGLLCERADGADLVGIGLNVNADLKLMPKALRNRVTSLKAIVGRAFDLSTVLSTIAEHLHRGLSHRDEQSFPAILRQYDSHHALVGRRVTVAGNAREPAVTGKCEGLDSIGRLLIRDRRMLHHIVAGHVDAI